MAHDPNHEGHVHKTDVEAKQASHRLMNFRTLIISLIVLVILGAVMLTVFFQETPQKFGATSNGVDTQPAVTEPAEPAATAEPETPAPATTDSASEPADDDTGAETESPADDSAATPPADDGSTTPEPASP